VGGGSRLDHSVYIYILLISWGDRPISPSPGPESPTNQPTNLPTEPTQPALQGVRYSIMLPDRAIVHVHYSDSAIFL
jgi:hypothetical protein